MASVTLPAGGSSVTLDAGTVDNSLFVTNTGSEKCAIHPQRILLWPGQSLTVTVNPGVPVTATSINGTTLTYTAGAEVQPGTGSFEPKGLSSATNTQLSATYGLFINAASYGTKGDGTTNDTTAIQAALTAVGAAGGGTVFFPKGVYLVASTLTVPSNTRLVGAGKGASIIKNASNLNPMVDFSGADNTHHTDHQGAADISFQGSTTSTGVLVKADYVSHLNFDRVTFAWHNDTALSMKEAWDCYLDACDFDQVGGPNYRTGAGVRLLGSSTDMTNEIYFSQCRWEGMPGHALFIDSNSTGKAPYGVWLSQCKMESARAAGASFLEASSDVTDVHVSDLYLALDTGSTGTGSTSLIQHVGAHNWTIEKVHAYTAVACDSIIRSWPSAYGHVIRDIFVAGTVKPTTGIINFAGGDPVMRISNVQYQDGTVTGIYGGTPGAHVLLNERSPLTIQTGTTYTASTTDEVIEVTNSAGCVVTLPSATGIAGKRYTVHNLSGGVAKITSSSQIDFQGTAFSIGTRANATVVSDGSIWLLVGNVLSRPVRQVAAAYQVLASDYIMECNAAASYTVTLPDATSVQGQEFVIFQLNATGTVTVACAAGGGATINGSATFALSALYAKVRVYSDGFAYYIIG